MPESNGVSTGVALPSRFDRIFKSRRGVVQYAVIRTSIGYAVTRWRAATDLIEPIRLFEFKDYPASDDSVACRNAATDFAEHAAKTYVRRDGE